MEVLPSGLPVEVDDCEVLSRGLPQSNWLTTAKLPAAFLPTKIDRNTSVLRTAATDAVRKYWQEHRPNVPLKGIARVSAGNVRAARVAVVSDEPPDTHAILDRWPWIENDLDEQRGQQKAIALQIASAAEVEVL